MKPYFLLAAVLISLFSFAQTDFQVGYQEFPTTITGQASDASGNMYYTGQFKGQLTVNGQVLTTGAGLEDIFWVKTAPNGQVLKYFTWGSNNIDLTFPDGMTMGDGQQMYFMVRGAEGINFGGIPLTSYPAPPPGPNYANGIVRVDTAGSVKWVKRTNLPLARIYSVHNLVHVIGMYGLTSGPIKVDNDVVFDSVGPLTIAYMVFDTSGTLLGKKTMQGQGFGDDYRVMEMKEFTDRSLFLSMRASADTVIFVNGTPVALPSTRGNYHLLIKTDTSFTRIRTRILNPANQSIYGFGTSTLTQALSAADSLYMVLNLEASNSYALDGYSIPIQTNSLVVMDSTLTVKRLKPLGPGFIASYPPSTMKRHVYFRNMAVSDNQLFFTGMYTGINEAPMNIVPPRDTVVPVVGTTKLSMDLNGPSKSFIARTDLGINDTRASWLGDHREYEYYNLNPSFLHAVNGNRLSFVQGADNSWNPWLADTSLAILSGTMRRNVDLPEQGQMVSFFDDGSRIILASAQGKTALDTASNIPCNSMRRDLFIAIFNKNGSVRWFSRIQTTLIQFSVRKLVMKNGKAWMLSSYNGSQSDSNFIRVGNQLYEAKLNNSLLASIDSAGNMNAINLSNVLYRYGIIQDFSFFSNGDLALLVNTQVVLSLPGFPGGPGVFLLRVNPSTGALIEARKLTGVTLPVVSGLALDKNNTLYISGQIPYSTSYPVTQIYLHNGLTTIDSVASVNDNTYPYHAGLMKMDWNRMSWYKRFTGASGASMWSFGDLHLANDRPVLIVRSSLNNLPLYWDSHLIHNGTFAGVPTLVGLDTAGNWVRSRALAGFNLRYARKTSGENLLLSGNIRSSVQMDTISIGNAGLSDALGLVMDSNFVAKRSFRLGSVLNESMFDMDIYRDSIAAFVYTAQLTPQLYQNRMEVLASDVDEDAYLTTLLLKTGVITSVGDPLSSGNEVTVAPNPLNDHQLRLRIRSARNTHASIALFNAGGQYAGSAVLSVSQGDRSYTIALPSTLSKGVYHVRVKTPSWTTTKTFLVQ